jgi:hypothetical protein
MHQPPDPADWRGYPPHAQQPMIISSDVIHQEHAWHPEGSARVVRPLNGRPKVRRLDHSGRPNEADDGVNDEPWQRRLCNLLRFSATRGLFIGAPILAASYGGKVILEGG